MTKYLILLLTAILFSCSSNEPVYLSQSELEKEKEKIKEVVQAYNQASENKNFAELVKTLHDEVIFFGTDSVEVIRTFADFKTAMEEQWEKFEKIDYGNITDVTIMMDDLGTMASIYFGVPCDITLNGITKHYYLRGHRTLKKNIKNNWVITSGLLSIVSEKVVERDTTE